MGLWNWLSPAKDRRHQELVEQVIRNVWDQTWLHGQRLASESTDAELRGYLRAVARPLVEDQLAKHESVLMARDTSDTSDPVNQVLDLLAERLLTRRRESRALHTRLAA